MKQIVKWISGVDFEFATQRVSEMTKEMNEEGYKLTFAISQCYKSQPSLPTDLMVVFNQEE